MDPFTLRIFVPDGDPEGVRIIDRMNWTGIGIVFPRGKWADVRKRAELTKTGVYILVGFKGENEDLPTVYIGQADGSGIASSRTSAQSKAEDHLGSTDHRGEPCWCQ